MPYMAVIESQTPVGRLHHKFPQIHPSFTAWANTSFVVSSFVRYVIPRILFAFDVSNVVGTWFLISEKPWEKRVAEPGKREANVEFDRSSHSCQT
jgi:hypothetical protein